MVAMAGAAVLLTAVGVVAGMVGGRLSMLPMMCRLYREPMLVIAVFHGCCSLRPHRFTRYQRYLLRELEREVRELRMKTEFLGKAAAFFAQEYR
jgi:hypothetical protein